LISFEWDRRKEATNKKKHKVSFEEAKSVFYDERALRFIDPDSNDEDRFLMLGLSYKLRILLVVHAYRKNDETIRIISARRATRKERTCYEEYIK